MTWFPDAVAPAMNWIPRRIPLPASLPEHPAAPALPDAYLYFGLELCESHPVCVGGCPTDPMNEAFVPIEEHAEIVHTLTRLLREGRARSGTRSRG
jgi:hypothetical protein